MARQQTPNSIRALFGSDGTCNAAHGSDSPASAANELAFFFGSPNGSNRNAAGVYSSASSGRDCARCRCTTLGVIKPHAVKDGLTGLLLDCIQVWCDKVVFVIHIFDTRTCQLRSCCSCSFHISGQLQFLFINAVLVRPSVKIALLWGQHAVCLLLQDVFDVTALQLFNLDKAAAAEFLEVYKGVVAPGEFRCASHACMHACMHACLVADMHASFQNHVSCPAHLC